MDITPLRIHSSLMNCFNKVIFLRFYDELKLHILSRDGKMLGLSPGIKISSSSKSGHSTFAHRHLQWVHLRHVVIESSRHKSQQITPRTTRLTNIINIILMYTTKMIQIHIAPYNGRGFVIKAIRSHADKLFDVCEELYHSWWHTHEIQSKITSML